MDPAIPDTLFLFCVSMQGTACKTVINLHIRKMLKVHKRVIVYKKSDLFLSSCLLVLHVSCAVLLQSHKHTQLGAHAQKKNNYVNLMFIGPCIIVIAEE